MADGLDVIKENTETLIALPWNGRVGMFLVRMLNATQLRACGDFSVFSHLAEQNTKNGIVDFDGLKELKNMQERMMQLALVKPTVKEIYDYFEQTESIQRMRRSIVEMREKLKLVEDVAEADNLGEEINFMENALGFLFPDDFASELTAFLLQKDNTDISKVTKDMLLEWAVLAEKGNDNPADHASGVFTDFEREEINKYAWIERARFLEQQNVVKNASGKTWLRAGKKRSV